ncbi:unnamed protein product [Trichobilharzia szidati]|nr:unnamed protein product [Trichobilharzia szidati]
MSHYGSSNYDGDLLGSNPLVSAIELQEDRKKIHQSLPQLNKRNGPNNLVSVNTHKQSPITELNMHFPSHNNKGLNRVLNKRQIHMNNHINSNTNTNNNDNNVNHINESNESNAFDYSVNRDEEDF